MPPEEPAAPAPLPAANTNGATTTSSPPKPGGPPSAPVRRPGPGQIPREAKISFAVGIGLLLLMLGIPILSVVISRMTPDTPPEKGPSAPGPTAPSGGTEPKRPRSGGGFTDGGGPSGGFGGVAVETEKAPPMPKPAFTVLRSLKAMLYEASHLPKGTQPGSVDVSTTFGPDVLDGASADTIRNLQLAQFRVARQPIETIRILGESDYAGGAKNYEYEVVSRGPGGEELTAYGTIAIDVTGTGAGRVANLSVMEPFDSAGGAHATAFDVKTKPTPTLLIPAARGAAPPEAKPQYPFTIE